LWRYDSGKGNITKVTPKADPVAAPASDTTVNVDDSRVKNSENFVVPGRVSRIKENNRIQYIIVNESDTRESIEKEFRLLNWELSRYNELKNDFTPVAGQILYLQPKRDRAEAGKEVHTVTKGDSMYSISQKYGVKLRKLYEMNRMKEGEEPVEGGRIWLRSNKPVN
jgi:LysM repeat protein